jgi:hypothetical protein
MAQKVFGVAMFKQKTQATDVVKQLCMVVFLKFFQIRNLFARKVNAFSLPEFQHISSRCLPSSLACLFVSFETSQ